MFPERFLPKKHRFVVRFQSKALAYTHMALLKECGILELSRTINIPLLWSEQPTHFPVWGLRFWCTAFSEVRGTNVLRL